MKVLTHSPFLTFHNINVLSSDPLITNYPSLEKLTELTPLVCLTKVLTHSPV
jgi:hypothetical protein